MATTPEEITTIMEDILSPSNNNSTSNETNKNKTQKEQIYNAVTSTSPSTTTYNYSKYNQTFYGAIIKLEPFSLMNDNGIKAFEVGTNNYVEAYFNLHGSSSSNNNNNRLLGSSDTTTTSYDEDSYSSYIAAHIDYSYMHNITVKTNVIDQDAPYLRRTRRNLGAKTGSENIGYTYITFDQTIYYYTLSSKQQNKLDINEYMDMHNPYKSTAYLESLHNQSYIFDSIKYVSFTKYQDKYNTTYDKLSHNFQIALGFVFISIFIMFFGCGCLFIMERGQKGNNNDNDDDDKSK